MAESALIFDTHEDIQELVNSGMPERQAETVVRQRVRLLERNLATKADIETLRQETKAGIEALRLETKANIDMLRQETEKLIALGKNDIIKWVIGANLGIAAMIVAAFKLL